MCKIPKVGFGTYKVIDQSAQGIVETALSVGYRHLDTARMYMNEKEVGAGMAASGIARKDIFLTTKVWRDDLSYDATMASVESSLKDLGTDYLDLCLLHWPHARKQTVKNGRKKTCPHGGPWKSFTKKRLSVPLVSATSCLTISCPS